jgi:DNA-binding NtrC family response regulator
MNGTQNASVLIVEDEYMNAWSLAVTLKPHFQVRHAATTEEALYWLNREKFFFIMMDIRIGHEIRAGFELLKEAKRINPAVMVFATTGMGLGKDADQYLAAGFHAYYPKPVNENEILAEMLLMAERGKAA